jgi:branched-chain amino acid transport system permease protein
MLLVASVGLILVFEEGIRITHRSRELWLPPILSEPIAVTLPPYVVTITVMQIATALVTTIIVACILCAMSWSRLGMMWRAVADDERAASLMGIDSSRVLTWSGIFAAVLAGLAGLIILVAYGNANHSMGLMFSIKAMVAAIIGGMGSPAGAVAGALLLAVVETCWVVAFGGAYRDAAVFAILIGLLTLAPNGLFGLRRV